MIVQAVKGVTTEIGRIGENVSRVVQFDVTKVLADFPEATISVLHQRPGDTDAYQVDSAYVALDGDTLNWTIQSEDVAMEGFGRCELIASANDVVVAKSHIYTTLVREALNESEDPPENDGGWITRRI